MWHKDVNVNLYDSTSHEHRIYLKFGCFFIPKPIPVVLEQTKSRTEIFNIEKTKNQTAILKFGTNWVSSGLILSSNSVLNSFAHPYFNRKRLTNKMMFVTRTHKITIRVSWLEAMDAFLFLSFFGAVPRTLIHCTHV